MTEPHLKLGRSHLCRLALWMRSLSFRPRMRLQHKLELLALACKEEVAATMKWTSQSRHPFSINQTTGILKFKILTATCKE